MTTNDIKQCLILSLQPILQATICDESILDRPLLVMGGKRYKQWEDENLPNPGWTGFIDWLKPTLNSIIGTRLKPLPRSLFKRCFPTLVPRYSYIEFHEDEWFNLYFTKERDYLPKLSDHADFGYNWIYISDERELVLTFALDRLSPEELNSIRTAPLQWVSAYGI